MKEYNSTGRIFDIQRFSLHDGDGIRTIVFLKGCLFRCRWCCNPESQEYAIQKMTVDGKEKTVGQDVTVAEVMAIVEKDRSYYRRSGGGITLSGGESLCQPDFAAALLKTACESGIHTAIESTACAEYHLIAKMLPYIGQFMLDLKHIDTNKHLEHTGKSNELILENAKKIALSGRAELSIRIPVIPGFNATVDEIAAIARFADKLNVVKRLYLLPYHRLGQDKYEQLGREYPIADILPPDEELTQKLLHAARDATTIPCQIGG